MDTPPTAIRAFIQAHPHLGLMTIMMISKMLPEGSLAALEDPNPFKAAGCTAAVAAIFDLAVLGPRPNLSIVQAPPDVPTLDDRIWKRSTEAWAELRRGALAPAAIESWMRNAVMAGG